VKRLVIPSTHVIPSAARDLLLLVVAAAVLYQGLIPAGYMVGTRADLAAGALVVACPAQNEPTFVQGLASMHAHHHHHDGGDAHKAHTLAAGHCVFAVAAAAGLPMGSISLAAALPPGEALIAPRPLALRAAHFRPVPPARGPPAFS